MFPRKDGELRDWHGLVPKHCSGGASPPVAIRDREMPLWFSNTRSAEASSAGAKPEKKFQEFWRLET